MARLSIAVLGAALALGAGGAFAHHGWAAYADTESDVSGVLESADLGAPHGQLKVRNAQGLWNVMLSPPAGIQRSGLTQQALPKGAKVTAHGHKRTDGTLEIKTERLVVGGRAYDVYPNRN